jgi:SAM-dependent methyltransferase
VTFADAKQRFSSRVADYVRYRPGYPSALIDVLHKDCGLRREHIVADIGSGTGLLSKVFLENGNHVIGVEPNAEMRAAGDEFLAEYTNFSSVDGSSEVTTLASTSVDFITVAQAFHWFEPEATRREFARILMPGGWVVVMWNDRRIGETSFGRAYEDLLVRYGMDYKAVREAYPEAAQMRDFLADPREEKAVAGLPHSKENFRRVELPNFQEFDFEGLAGRLRSSSYAPREDHAKYEPMMDALRKLFDANQKFGRVRMEYTTQIYFGRLVSQ